MLSFKNLFEVYEKSVEWEQNLYDLYEVAEIGVQNEESKSVISMLLKKQKVKLDILKGIDPDAFGLNKWVRYVSDYKEDEIIPKKEIKRDSTPKEILELIFEYEGKMKKFYSSIMNILNTEEQKEFFKSLVTFKENQMTSLKSIIEDYENT